MLLATGIQATDNIANRRLLQVSYKRPDKDEVVPGYVPLEAFRSSEGHLVTAEAEQHHIMAAGGATTQLYSVSMSDTNIGCTITSRASFPLNKPPRQAARLLLRDCKERRSNREYYLRWLFRCTGKALL